MSRLNNGHLFQSDIGVIKRYAIDSLACLANSSHDEVIESKCYNHESIMLTLHDERLKRQLQSSSIFNNQ